MKTITLTAAYGRSYKDKTAVRSDLLMGRDFEVHHPMLSGYATLRELLEHGFTHAQVRYNTHTMAMIDLNKVAE